MGRSDFEYGEVWMTSALAALTFAPRATRRHVKAATIASRYALPRSKNAADVLN
jgi:hypothetical protein